MSLLCTEEGYVRMGEGLGGGGGEDSDEMSNQQNGSANWKTYVFALHRRRVCER